MTHLCVRAALVDVQHDLLAASAPLHQESR
jgi:hypothetical protein